MTGHFKAFKRATGDTYWDMAQTKCFGLLDHCQSVISPPGLMPDFLRDTGTNPVVAINGQGDGDGRQAWYTYNACRVPMRMGIDHLTSGDVRAKNIGNKIVDFFNNKYAGSVEGVRDAYQMNGARVNEGSTYNASLFYETLLPAACSEARHQVYLNRLWTKTNAYPRTTGYYGTELGLLSIIASSGNWWNP